MRVALGCSMLGLLALHIPANADFANAYRDYKAGNLAQARAQFLELAALGDGPSQFNLGAMALRGEAVEKNEGVAAGWLRAAFQNGHTALAENRLALMEAGLSSSEQEAAAAVLSRYGRAALEASVLPAYERVRCRQRFAPARTRQLAALRYPLLAPGSRQDGIVVVQFLVGIDGLARDPEILSAAPPGKFDNATIDSILESRFHPAMLDGVPIEAREMIRVTFVYGDGGELWDVDAVKRVKAAAATGDPGSRYIAGMLGVLDPSLKIPVDDARKMLLGAAQAGHAGAQYWVGTHLQNESHCTGVEKTRPWLEQAAKGGLSNAQIAYARYLIAQEDATAVDRVRALLQAAAQSTDEHSVKHATALLSGALAPNLADAPAALIAARKLDKMTAGKDPQVSEAIAAAFAANGDFQQAVRHQKRALDTAEDLYWNLSAMQARLDAYGKGTSWQGDLFAVPPVTGVLPEVDDPHEANCRKRKQGCQRKPDEKRAPTGSFIER